MIARLWIYFRVMQPLHLTVLFSLLHYVSFFCFLSAVSQKYVLPPVDTWYAVATTALFYITFRLNDDIKDEEFDRRYHPDRPMITGEVRYSDLKILAIILFAMMVALNIERGLPTSVFMILAVFLALSANWFYFPREVRRSYVLTLATGGHPILVLANLYFFAVFQSVVPSATPSFLFLAGTCLLFAMPSMAWEISRKVKAPSEEVMYPKGIDFPSYSLLWGVRRATLVPMIYILIVVLSFLGIGAVFDFSGVFMFAISVLGIGTLGTYCLFLYKPIPQRNLLKPANEAFDVLARFIIIAEVVVPLI